MEELINSLEFNFKQLYSLKRDNLNLYNEFFILVNIKEMDILNSIRLLYIAYYLNHKISYKDFEQIIGSFSLLEIIEIYSTIFSIKNNNNFRTSFKRKTKGISIPDFKLEDVEDYYTYYVLILEMSEELFWNFNFSFLISVSENKSSYDTFISNVREKANLERRR